MTAISSMPTVVVTTPAIEVAAGLPRTSCQVHTRDWIDGAGFAFTYCPAPQRFLIGWSIADRWHTRRQLRVCVTHASEFAAANGLTIAVAASSTASTHDDSLDDSDQPFDRVRATSQGRGGGSDVSA